MAEYVAQRHIAGNPVFAWWVRHVLAKHNRIIGNMKSKYWVGTHKFVIKIPKSVQESKTFDKKNSNKLSWEAICKEMTNIRPTFEVWEKAISDFPPGYQ